VARRGSFAVVASDRGTDPSSLSRMIASLEDELRVCLLQRSTRRMTLTEVGAKYLGRIEPLLEEIDQARDEALARSVRPIGTIRITGRCVSRCPFIGAKQKSRGSAPHFRV